MSFTHVFGRQPDTPAAGDPDNFSIVLGGPLYQLLRRTRIAGDALELVRRRIVVIALFAWLPLLVLAIAGGRAWGDEVAVPFIKDLQVHLRFLVAMPLLIAAEILVHRRLHPVAHEFLERGLVPAESVERFRECVRSAYRLRNSISAEVVLVALVYGVGIPVVWRYYGALDVSTWYATSGGDGSSLTPAGLWYVYVSVPCFQFLLLRWYFRIAIWIRFLWQVSRIPLNISAMHPDEGAGLAFLSSKVFAFAPLLAAHGTILAGTIANRIFFQGGTLMEARIEIAVIVVFLLVLVLAPLTVFAPQVAAAKRRAGNEYARLGQRYVVDFEGKWLPQGVPAAASPLGEADVQSLADLSNAYAAMRRTRSVPITREAILKLGFAVLAPVAPLVLTMIPAEDLVRRLLKLLL